MQDIRKLLKSVEKPGRYLGNEFDTVKKNLEDVDVRFAFAFPDVYEIGMSYLGLQILYRVLNNIENVWCERVFSVGSDMEDLLRKNNRKLFALESKSPLNEFDFLGVTLQYEMSYTNILNMLDLGGIPIYQKDRKNKDTFVVFGGPCAYNVEPMADFADIVLLGEGEEILPELMALYQEHKKGQEDFSREKFLLDVAIKIKGAYVPSLYKANYEKGLFLSMEAKFPQIPAVVEKRIISDLDKGFILDKLVIPHIDVIHSRVMLELFRGCTRGCRFCQAGMVYRPVRERSVETLLKTSQSLIQNSGYEEMSLTSLSSSDYSHLLELLDALKDQHIDENVNLSLPSLRVDNFSIDLAEKLSERKKSGLTLAPEAGTQRLRNVINKCVTKQDLIQATSSAFEKGWRNVKLYFMIGLPTETYEDLDGIVDLAHAVIQAYKDVNGNKGLNNFNVTISTSVFVPKANTPFQWVAQENQEVTRAKQEYLREKLRHKNIKYKYHDTKLSFLEATIAKGDRRMSSVIYQAFLNGCKFDSWSESFKYDEWMQAFEQTEVNPMIFANTPMDVNAPLAWDHLSCGVSKRFLQRELEKAYNEIESDDCRKQCLGCEINKGLAKGLCG